MKELLERALEVGGDNLRSHLEQDQGNNEQNWKGLRMVRNILVLLCVMAGGPVLFVLGGGCSWTSGPWPSYAPASLTEKIKKQEPVDDFVRLRKLFKDHGGDLVSRDDKVVKWKDTRMFRMFEFKHHTVVIFPYNWLDGSRKDERFDLHMFAGHVKDYTNLYTAFGYSFDPPDPRTGKGARYYNTKMDLDVGAPAVQDVGFEGFSLGELKSNLIEKQVGYLRERGMRVQVKAGPGKQEYEDGYVASLDAAGNVVGSLTWWDDNRMCGWCGDTGTLHFEFWFEDGKLSYAHFFTEKCPLLWDYGILKPVLPVLEEGEFEIPTDE